MPVIKVEGFSGVALKIDAKRLPPGNAQIAEDCIFQAGDLRPLGAPVTASWGGATPGVVDRLHNWRGRWLAWTGDVDVVNTPVANDQWDRIYWTRGLGLKPRFATVNTMASNIDLTALGEDLGVIGPQSAPTIIPSEIEEPSITAETLAQTTPVRVSVVTDHPFSDGQRVIVTLTKREGAGAAVPDTPPDRTGMVELAGESYVIRTIKTDAGPTDLRSFDLIGADGAGFSAYQPDNWVATIKRVYSDQDEDTRSYVYTFVSQYGEESQPSPPSDPLDVLRGSAVTVQAQVSAAQISAGYRVRLYRSVTGSGGTGFFFITEVPAASGSLQIVDDLDDARLGELLPSETWTPPPDGLTGLVAMPGGFLAAFIAGTNTLCFSEPYMPHAWPLQYRRTTQDGIIGLGVYGQTLVVATRGKPYLAPGSDPGSISLQQLDDYAPCVAKSCLSASGTGVIYPSLDGLVHVSAAGVRRLTDAYFTKALWEAITQFPIASIWHNGRYFMSVSGSTWVFEPFDKGTHISRTLIGNTARAFAVNTSLVAGNGSIPRDTLHFVDTGGTSAIRAFDRGAAQTARWIGRVETLPKPCAFAAAQVYATSYPVTVQFHAAWIAGGQSQPPSLLYPASNLLYEKTVTGPEAFRLPHVPLSREWRIDIITNAAVQTVCIATSMDEIALA